MTSAFTRLMALGIIAALAVVAVVTIRAIDASAVPDAPEAGDIHAETGCVWVANSQTMLYSVYAGDAHVGLLPLRAVWPTIRDGIAVDGETRDFFWYWGGEWHHGKGYETGLLYAAHYEAQSDVVSQQFNDAYHIKYTSSGDIGLQMWHENHPSGGITRSGVKERSISSGTGEQWAYVHSTARNNYHSLLSTDCWHILPSTPAGHESHITE